MTSDIFQHLLCRDSILQHHFKPRIPTQTSFSLPRIGLSSLLTGLGNAAFVALAQNLRVLRFFLPYFSICLPKSCYSKSFGGRRLEFAISPSFSFHKHSR